MSRRETVSLAGLNGERADAIAAVLRRTSQRMTPLQISQSIYLDRECFGVLSPYETTQTVLRAMLAAGRVERVRGTGGSWFYELTEAAPEPGAVALMCAMNDHQAYGMSTQADTQLQPKVCPCGAKTYEWHGSSWAEVRGDA